MDRCMAGWALNAARGTAAAAEAASGEHEDQPVTVRDDSAYRRWFPPSPGRRARCVDAERDMPARWVAPLN